MFVMFVFNRHRIFRLQRISNRSFELTTFNSFEANYTSLILKMLATRLAVRQAWKVTGWTQLRSVSTLEGRPHIVSSRFKQTLDAIVLKSSLHSIFSPMKVSKVKVTSYPSYLRNPRAPSRPSESHPSYHQRQNPSKRTRVSLTSCTRLFRNMRTKTPTTSLRLRLCIPLPGPT